MDNFSYSTAIATVAVEVMYSKEALAFCRTDQIMADAAYAVLTKNSRTRTGEFLYDEDILKQEGITDYDQYLVSPGKYAHLVQKKDNLT